jgi:cell division protein FtsI/penicillin-binding protein 2
VNRWFQYRCILLCSALVVVLSVLSGRLIQIQLVHRQRYAESSSKAFLRIEKLPALRGTIIDRREQELAESMPMASLYVNKRHLLDPKIACVSLAYLQARSESDWDQLDPTKRQRRINGLRVEILDSEKADVIIEKHLALAVGELARLVDMTREELRAKIDGNLGKWFPIAKDLPEDQVDQIRKVIEDNQLQGFDFENSIKRWYTSPDLATHLLGYTGDVKVKDENGKTYQKMKGLFGVEAAMEKYLAGRDGWREHRRDQRGLVVPGDSTSLLPPKAGLNVKLTLDMGLQSIVEEELDAALGEYVAERGAVVLMDPKTGDVLAMASRPHFNLNHKEDLENRSFNYAIQAVYEPGSTIKVVAASGALNAGLVSLTSQIFCHNGYFQSGNVKVTDDHPAGMLSFVDVLKKSNNIGTYMMGRKLGSKAFYDHLTHMGFGQKTDLLLSGERSGTIGNTRSSVDFSRACFGYSINVTPIQMACAYSVIAGDGRLLKPRIVDSIIANDGSIFEEFPVETVYQTLQPKAAAQMREALVKVTEKGGTATRAAVPGFKVAGKTGTAKKTIPGKRGYSDALRVVSFVGMMPAQDPAFVCVVVIDEPKTNAVKRQGGMIAAPVFSKIATRVAARMNLQPTEPIPAPLAAQ